LTSAANLPLKWSSSLAIYFIFWFKKYNLELGLQTLGTLRVFKRVIEIQY
jgi:hypothetical protein